MEEVALIYPKESNLEHFGNKGKALCFQPSNSCCKLYYLNLQSSKGYKEQFRIFPLNEEMSCKQWAPIYVLDVYSDAC